MSIFKKLGKGIADLSELNVQTFTGDIATVIRENAEGSVIDWTKLLTDAKNTTEGKIKLVASARIKFDGDSDSYFDEDIRPDLLKAHLTAIEAGQNVREGLMEMFKETLGLI